MDHYKPSDINMRLGAQSNLGRNAEIGAVRRFRLSYCIAAFFLGVSSAQAEYLLDLSVPPHNRLGLSFPGSSPGYYPAVSSNRIAVTQTEFLNDLAVSPHARLGLSFPGSKTGYYPALSFGGMGVARLVVSWELHEPQYLERQWDGLRKRCDALRALGIEPFLTFEADNPLFTRPETHGLTNQTPLDMNHWLDFVREAVENTQAKYYQFVNEWDQPTNPAGGWLGTDQELVDFVNQSAAAVKEVNPSARVIMGGIVSTALDILVLNKGLADYQVCHRAGPDDTYDCRSAIDYQDLEIDAAIARGHMILAAIEPNIDALDLHLYGPADRDPARIQAIKNIWSKPLLSAECGGPSLSYQDYVPEDHFMAVIERNLLDLSEGLEFCLWFRLKGNDDGPWAGPIQLSETQEPDCLAKTLPQNQVTPPTRCLPISFRT